MLGGLCLLNREMLQGWNKNLCNNFSATDFEVTFKGMEMFRWELPDVEPVLEFQAMRLWMVLYRQQIIKLRSRLVFI
jgi:hypothetical protein